MGAEELFNMTLFLPSASEGAGMYKLESSVNSAKDGLFCLLKLLESCLRVPPTRSKESMYVRMSALCSTHSNETRPLPQKGHIVESRRFWPVHALRKQESLESREYLVLLFCEVSHVCLTCAVHADCISDCSDRSPQEEAEISRFVHCADSRPARGL